MKICPVCDKEFFGQKIFCSRKCANSIRKKSRIQKEKEILDEIKAFYKNRKRIPTKKERLGLAWRAHMVFGGWNRAIKAAGFKPNPVIFSKKFIANDGHKCDSFAEKIIDDWLASKKIKHERGIYYPGNKSLTVDFVIKNIWIEFFGLFGEVKDYDKIIKKKRMLSKKYKLPLVEIYPKDLFPVNNLAKILKI